MPDRADDDAGIRFPPPLVFLGFGLLGWTAERPSGIRLPDYPDWIAWAVGLAFAAIGTGLIGSALAMFRRVGTRPEPWQPTSAITREGVYGRTRNPMYLGMACLHLGIAAGFQSPGFAIGLLPALIVVDRLVIRREEAYLLRRFGAAYEDYKASVRRWL